MKTKGFTLIEIMVYLGLFAIIFGGAIAAAYSVFETNGHNLTKIMVQEEGDFLIAKINWALSGVSSVTLPAAGSGGPMLSVSKWNPPSGNPIVISVSGINTTISEGGNPPEVLNNTNTQISNVNFVHTAASGDGINPESVEARFTVSSRTPGGSSVSEDFSSTNYVRR